MCWDVTSEKHMLTKLFYETINFCHIFLSRIMVYTFASIGARIDIHVVSGCVRHSNFWQLSYVSLKSGMQHEII